MYCKNCGSLIDNDAVVCPHCGVATDKFAGEVAPVKNQKNTLAIVGFIFSFLISIVGLICSILGFKKASTLEGKGKGLAIAGIIISVINMVLGVVLMTK